MPTFDSLMRLHPKTRAKLKEVLLTAALISVHDQSGWRTYVTAAKNRSVGRLRKILTSVTELTDEQFTDFVEKI